MLLAACSDGGGGSSATPTPVEVAGDGQVTITASEWQFEPSSITVHQGSSVSIELRNDGRVLHDLKIEDLEASDVEVDNSGPLEGDEGELFVSSEAGESGTLSFVPLGPGTYTYYCTLEGHRNLGMEGTLTVQ
jgi:uncharacterized cupredoxin-like copper-binding protein